MASNVSDSDIRILLIGRTGHGKSSTGNTIVGHNVFEVCGGSTSETKTCKWSKKCKRLGRTVEVVDTPGMFDTDQSNHTVHKELLKSLVLSTPGFHAIAFVLMRQRFTEELQKTLDLFFEWFGPGVEQFACVILTNTDSEVVKDEYLNTKPHPKLTELVEKCNNRVVPLNNVADSEKTTCQVECLFQAVEEMKRNNENQYFSNVVFKLAESYAMNKYPRRLTNESIHILLDAGLPLELTQARCRYLDTVFEISTYADRVDSSNSESQSSVSEADDSEVEEETKQLVSEALGNLSIYDNSSNEPVPNTVVKNNKPKTCRRKRKVNAKESGSDYMKIKDMDHLGEHDVPGKRNKYGTSSINSIGSDYILYCRTENEVDYGSSDLHELGSDQIDSEHTSNRHIFASEGQGETGDGHEPYDQRKKQDEQSERNAVHTRRHQIPDGQSLILPGRTHTSRLDRIIDIESVRYDPVDEFKDRVNNGDNELKRFFGHIRNAWRYCKQKIPCTLL